jgi:hypothetical protein
MKNYSVEKYYEHSIYDYWIFSSHNTYLTYDQISESSNLCYYNLIMNIFMGGCVEIDLYNLYEDPKTKEKDIMVKHSPNQKQFVKLSKIMNTIVKTMKKKFDYIKQNINVPVGPVIVSFDNKKTITDETQTVFWDILHKTLYCTENKNNDMFPNDIFPWVQIINKDITLMKISLEQLNGKILIRGKEKKNPTDSKKTFIQPPYSPYSPYSPKYKKKEIPTDNICIQPHKIFMDKTKWFNITNTKLYAFEQINENKNLSESLGSYGSFGSKNKNIKNVEKTHMINANVILNSYNNLIRIYPNGIRIYSNNYDNYGYLLNGIQMVAINLQVLDKSWFINMAIFNPLFNTKCKNNICLKDYTIEQMLNVKSFVLKPDWLIGLSKYPQLYDLTMTFNMPPKFTKHLNDDIHVSIGNNKIKGKLNKGFSKLTLIGINVTIPVLFIKINHLLSSYVIAVKLLWDETNLSNNIIVYPIKLNKKKILLHHYNNPSISDTDESCNNSDLMNIIKQIELSINYVWEKSSIVDPKINELNNLVDKNITFTNINDSNDNKQQIINKFSPKPIQLDISVDEDDTKQEFSPDEKKVAISKKIPVDDADTGDLDNDK